MRRDFMGGLLLAAPLLFLGSCEQKSSTSKGPVDLAVRGKQVYFSNCVACHGTNPKKKGPLGPAVHGSSLELLQLRVLDTKYPAGYQPKAKTKVMVALPHLKADIPALHKFLNQ